jgi:hypothetical protein
MSHSSYFSLLKVTCGFVVVFSKNNTMVEKCRLFKTHFGEFSQTQFETVWALSSNGKKEGIKIRVGLPCRSLDGLKKQERRIIMLFTLYYIMQTHGPSASFCVAHCVVCINATIRIFASIFNSNLLFDFSSFQMVSYNIKL